MAKFIFDGVQYYYNDMKDVFYKKKFMGKYQQKNGDKIIFLSPDELMFHCQLKKHTNETIIKGKSLFSIDNINNYSSNKTILSFIQNSNKKN